MFVWSHVPCGPLVHETGLWAVSLAGHDGWLHVPHITLDIYAIYGLYY